MYGTIGQGQVHVNTNQNMYNHSHTPNHNHYQSTLLILTLAISFTDRVEVTIITDRNGTARVAQCTGFHLLRNVSEMQITHLCVIG